MPLTDRWMQPGEWSLTLKWAGGRSPDYWNELVQFGHVMVFPSGYVLSGKTDAQNKAASLYTGILIDKGKSGDGYSIGGTNLMGHLGEAGMVGWIIEPPAKEYDGTTFVNTMRDLLGSTGPGDGTPLQEGSTPGITGTGLTGTYYNTHVWETKLDAMRYVCSVFQAGNNKYVEIRVDHDGTFHAGVFSQLFGASPVGFVVKRDGGDNPGALEFGNAFSQDTNFEGVATRVVVQGQGNGETIMYGSADLSPNPYKDFFGNPLKRTMLVNEPETTIANADARATNHLNDSQDRFRAITFDTYEWKYDPDSIIPGNRVWVYDPEDDFFQNLSNPQAYGGGTIYPISMNVVSITRPLTAGMVVAYRDANGVYTDITDIVVTEDHGVSMELGNRRQPSARDYDLMKNILMNKVAYNPVTAGASGGTVNTTTGELTTPAQMTWRNTPWGFNNRYLELAGITVADLLVQWNVPLNTDGSVITDGDRYELQYRKAADSSWSTRVIPFGLDEEWFEGWEIGQWSFRIRCVDTTNVAGTWSATETVTLSDSLPPSQPKAPTLAGNVLEIQVTHALGIQGDTDYTLEKDLDHLNVYASTTSGFTPSSANLIGQIPVTLSHLTLGIPVVATFPMQNADQHYVKVKAVDKGGLESASSPQAAVTASLITAAYIEDATITTAKIGDAQITTAKIADLAVGNGQISDLDATKINAGFISVDRLEGRTITFDKLVVGNLDNLAIDPSFDLGATAYENVYTGQLNGGTLSSGTGNPRTGIRALRFDYDSQSATSYLMLTPGGVIPSTPYVGPSCAVGDEFYLEFWFRYVDTAPGAASIRAQIRWYKEDGTLISGSISTAQQATTSYQKISVTGTAPALAAYCVPTIVVDYLASGGGGGSTDNAYLFEDVYFRRAIGSAMFASDLQSDNYVSLTSGWRITRDSGIAEFQSIKLVDNVNFYRGSTQEQYGFIGVGGSFAVAAMVGPLYLYSFEGGALGSSSYGRVNIGGGTVSDVLQVDEGSAGLSRSHQIRVNNSIVDNTTRPHIAFTSDADTGIGWITNNAFGMFSGGSEAMRVRSNGPSIGLVDGSVSIPSVNFINDLDTGIYMPTTAQFAVACAGGQELLLGTAGFFVPNVYSATNAGAANVFVGSDGQLYRSTSSTRYKKNVLPWTPNENVLALTPVTFEGMIGLPEVMADGTPVYERGKKKITMTPTGETFLGLTAEDVATAFPLGAIYDEDGQPDAINWNAIVAALIYEVSKLRNEVDTLIGSA